jgi:hypothetical protein
MLQSRYGKTWQTKKNPEELLTYPRFGVTAAELERLTEIADQNEVSVSYLIRAAGTAVAQNPELAEEWLAGMGGAAVPGPDSEA